MLTREDILIIREQAIADVVATARRRTFAIVNLMRTHEDMNRHLTKLLLAIDLLDTENLSSAGVISADE